MRISATLVSALLALCPVTAGAADGPVLAGLSLADALTKLRAEGLAIVYSSAVVTPEMRVSEEPTGEDPRSRLDQILAPHGLVAQPGPGGTILVVTAPPAPAGPATGEVRGVVTVDGVPVGTPEMLVEIEGAPISVAPAAIVNAARDPTADVTTDYYDLLAKIQHRLGRRSELSLNVLAVDDVEAGIIMPGTVLLGSRYFLEIAPGIAEDRAEHVAMDATAETEAGTFEDCLEVWETTPLDPGELGIKLYAPGIGLVIDDVTELVEYTDPDDS